MHATKPQHKALEHTKTANWPLCDWKCLSCYIKLNEEGAQKVADLRTSVAQDAILDHIGPDFRCQNEAMTTRNCWFYRRNTNDSWFEHNVCNETATQGIEAHKNGHLAAMWLEMLVFVH